MKVAIIGSRCIFNVNIEAYLPRDCQELISGGAKGVDTCVSRYANQHIIKLTEFLPLYKKYGRAAPIVRNKQIVDYADEVIAFWDGKSKGTLSVIKYCEKTGKPCRVIICECKKTASL